MLKDARLFVHENQIGSKLVRREAGLPVSSQNYWFRCRLETCAASGRSIRWSFGNVNLQTRPSTRGDSKRPDVDPLPGFRNRGLQ